MPFTLYDAAQGLVTIAMKLSDGEKLILAMLADIYKHLRIKGAVHPDLVREAMYGGHAWGLRLEYPDILGATETEPSVVRETIDIRTCGTTLKLIGPSSRKAIGILGIEGEEIPRALYSKVVGRVPGSSTG